MLLSTMGIDDLLLDEQIAKIVDNEPLRREPIIKNITSHNNLDSENKELKSITKCLQELAEFVVKENYKHHVGKRPYECIKDEINSVYQEELQYIDSSTIFVVRDNTGKIVGSIRVFKWDRKKILPIQKIFGINPLEAIHAESDYSYWHIGRFAIDSFAGIPTITLFHYCPVKEDYSVFEIVET